MTTVDIAIAIVIVEMIASLHQLDMLKHKRLTYDLQSQPHLIRLTQSEPPI
jgi:hypothetical protein